MIMYSSNKYIHHQYYVSTEWTGGIFVSPTLAGSRSGGIIAATWASLMHHGWNGYTQMTRDVIKAANVVRFIYIRVTKRGLMAVVVRVMVVLAFQMPEP